MDGRMEGREYFIGTWIIWYSEKLLSVGVQYFKNLKELKKKKIIHALSEKTSCHKRIVLSCQSSC